MRRSTAVVECPKSMVGRVIGKNGETIKALQSYSGALIQIDQTLEPTKVTISGTPHSLSLAVSMVSDIVKGTFKGFALLRQVTQANAANAARPAPIIPVPTFAPSVAAAGQPRPVYAPGYGLIPPSQLYGGEDRTASAMAAYGGQLGVASQAQQFSWPGQASPTQMILGLQAQHGGGVGGMGLLNGQLQQMQQAYGMTAPFGGLAFYPQDFAGGGQDASMYNDPALYQQMMAAAAASQQQQQQHQAGLSDVAMRMTAGRLNMMQGGGGRSNGSMPPGVGVGVGVGSKTAAHDWLPGTAATKLTNGAGAVNELLGVAGGGGDVGGGLGAANPMGTSVLGQGTSSPGNLVMDQDGKVFFYNPLQDN